MNASTDQLLRNRILCPNPRCKAALLASARVCRFCQQSLTPPAMAKKSTPALPTVFEVVVYGTPVTQGSMSRARGGGLKHKDELHPWRQAIEDALREAYETPEWEPITGPIRGDLVITLPRPASLPKKRAVYPTSHRAGDLDKFERAVNDSASPKGAEKKADGKMNLVKDGPNKLRPHFRLLEDDSQIVEWGTGPVKTYPRPFHTHPGALDAPGIRVRYTRLEEPTGLLSFDGESV